MRGKRTIVTIRRRLEGERLPGGERPESWPAVTGGHRVGIHIRPLSRLAQASLAETIPGQIRNSTHLAFLRTGTDVNPDDRLVDVAGNQYVVRSVDSYQSHIEATCEITNKQ